MLPATNFYPISVACLVSPTTTLESPYSVSFAIYTASRSFFTLKSGKTGPNTSSLNNILERSVISIIVGSKKFPFFSILFPPNNNFPPYSTDFLTYLSILSAKSYLAIGPTSTSFSKG